MRPASSIGFLRSLVIVIALLATVPGLARADLTSSTSSSSSSGGDSGSSTSSAGGGSTSSSTSAGGGGGDSGSGGGSRVVPEPLTSALLGLGAALAVLWHRRRGR